MSIKQQLNAANKLAPRIPLGVVQHRRHRGYHPQMPPFSSLSNFVAKQTHKQPISRHVLMLLYKTTPCRVSQIDLKPRKKNREQY